MDLKSYANQNINLNNNQTNNTTTENINDFAQRADNGQLNASEQSALNDLKQQYGDQVEDLISKFQGMSETELLGEVFKLINKQKQEGTFDPEKLKNIAQTIKPMLNADQQGKLDDLLQLISL